MIEKFKLPFKLFKDNNWRADLIVEINTNRDKIKAQHVINELGIGQFYRSNNGSMFFQVESVNVSKQSGLPEPINLEIVQNHMKTHR